MEFYVECDIWPPGVNIYEMLSLLKFAPMLLGGDSIKIIIIGLAALFILSTVYAGYRYVTGVIEANAQYKVIVSKQERAIKEQKKAIDFLEVKYKEVVKINSETTRRFRASTARVHELEKSLARHNLTKLGKRRPKAIQRISNKTVRDLNRCFELASGAERTQKELAATKLSQINRHCPERANPNYKPEQK